MLKAAYHRPMSSPWVVRGAWAQMNSNTVMETNREGSLGTDELEYCHGDKQGGETIE